MLGKEGNRPAIRSLGEVWVSLNVKPKLFKR